MYNLDIANLDNFYVGEQGWLVHNIDCPTLVSRLPKAGGGLTVGPGTFTQSEIESASKLAAYGNQVELRAATGNARLSDLLVNGVSYDVYTPKTTRIENILSAIIGKNNQAQGVVVDLRNVGNLPYSEAGVLTRVQELGATNIQDIVFLFGGQ
jgi:filamentous hemagglutinin